MKADTTRPPGATLPAQQQKFNRCRAEFNHERPHEALDRHTRRLLCTLVQEDAPQAATA